MGEGCIFGHNNNLKDTAHLHFLRILFEVINFMWNCQKLTRLRVSSFHIQQEEKYYTTRMTANKLLFVYIHANQPQQCS